MKKLRIVVLTLLILYVAIIFIVPPIIEKSKNGTHLQPPYTVSENAKNLTLSFDFIADLHSDALLWGRNLTKKADYGHVDFPRMQEGNVAFQVFTVVSKSPSGQNMESNSDKSLDNITLLNIVQGRPLSNWFSLMDRTLEQARRLQKFADQYQGDFILVKSKADFDRLIKSRIRDKKIIGGLLGVEGAHALEGKIENLEILYNAGVRLIGPVHFFDNEMGGSAHGISGEGLTDFGKEVIREMNKKNMIIDLAHASPEMIDDVIALSTQPVMVSHTGLYEVLRSPRNLTDEQIKKIAEKGGIIGIALFDEAVGSNEINGAVACFKHIKSLVGVEHAALGSDFDGSVTVPFDVTGYSLLADALLNEGFTEQEIKMIFGENVRHFISNILQ